MNYIVKNCPAYKDNDYFSCGYDIMKPCQDCTDCVLKQIVELCKKEIKQNVLTERKLFANELLEKLDIQEVE